jgi:hypothetical protein
MRRDRGEADRDAEDRVAVTRDIKAFEYVLLSTGEITQPNPDRPVTAPGCAGA